MGSLSHGDTGNTEGSTAAGSRLDQCECWIRPDEGAVLTAPQTPTSTTQHFTSLAQQLHTSLNAHPLTRLLLDDIEVNLGDEQRLQARDTGLAASRDLTDKGMMCDTGEVRLKASKRCEFGETQCEDDAEEGEGASVAKRMRTEQVVLSL
ncbi:hypothetical protein GWK47_026617 [Chionoecetes opilio]|uniref:Uncharacterized protein n=1 Tax=Chionoecetes opilio TaxID=41210 RepID=A0A8J8WL33_CHIOP|nr:hypothetical protein GWK47_026617 [Chionoecetes opilio]